MTPDRRAALLALVKDMRLQARLDNIPMLDFFADRLAAALAEEAAPQPTELKEAGAARSAANFLKFNARRYPHTEAVADCPHCNVRYLAEWALDVLGPEPERLSPPGPPDPPRAPKRAQWTDHPVAEEVGSERGMSAPDLRQRLEGLARNLGPESYDSDTVRDALSRLDALTQERDELRTLKADVFDNPQKWMRWCDHKTLERCEAAESQLCEAQEQHTATDEALARLVRYARHEAACPMNFATIDERCTCGLSDLLQSIRTRGSR